MMKWSPLNGMDLIPVRQLESEARQAIDDERVKLVQENGHFRLLSCRLYHTIYIGHGEVTATKHLE